MLSRVARRLNYEAWWLKSAIYSSACCFRVAGTMSLLRGTFVRLSRLNVGAFAFVHRYWATSCPPIHALDSTLESSHICVVIAMVRLVRCAL